MKCAICGNEIEDEYLDDLLLLKKRLREEQKVGMRPGVFVEEFLYLSREEQDFCIKYIEKLPMRLKAIQKQKEKEQQ